MHRSNRPGKAPKRSHDRDEAPRLTIDVLHNAVAMAIVQVEPAPAEANAPANPLKAAGRYHHSRPLHYPL